MDSQYEFVESDKAKTRIALREVLVAWGTSELAQVQIYRPAKKMKIPCDSILYETYRPFTISSLVKKMQQGQYTPSPCIVVTRYVVFNTKYYVVTDGNHRSAAACIAGISKISAEILGEVDLSNAPISLDGDSRIIVQTKDPAWWTVTGNVVTGRERELIHKISKLQARGYSHEETRNKTWKRARQVAQRIS
jgi:hypothetical protein